LADVGESFLASAMLLLSSSLFWNIALRWLIVRYWGFGTRYLSYFRGLEVQDFSWSACILKMGQITLSRNFGKKLPTYTAQHPARKKPCTQLFLTHTLAFKLNCVHHHKHNSFIIILICSFGEKPWRNLPSLKLWFIVSYCTIVIILISTLLHFKYSNHRHCLCTSRINFC
jgi:hypothetical protein